MNKLQLYTLIFGIVILIILTYSYLHFRMNKWKLRRAIMRGSKSLQRMYYTLKCNHYRIVQFNKTFFIHILFDNKLLNNKFEVVAIAQKDGKKYLCFKDEFMMNEDQINTELLFKLFASRYKKCLLIDTYNYHLQKVELL